MSRKYVFGEAIAATHLAEALPRGNMTSMAVWTEPWENISHLTSPVYEIRLADDIWQFPKRLFRETSANAWGGPRQRSVSFKELSNSNCISDVQGTVRRAKRMCWLYLHAPNDSLRRIVTAVDRQKKFILVIKILAEARAFNLMPDNSCPDGPMFFRELAKTTFDQYVPVHKPVRNGIILLDGLPNEIDDRPQFSVKTYSQHWEKKAKERNISQGKHPKSVSLTAVDDHNLSKLLELCDTYRKYPDVIESVWDWLEVHRAQAEQTGKKTGVFRENGQLMEAHRVKSTFQKEILEQHRVDWVAAGSIIDDEGMLAIPIYSNTNRVYRQVWDFANQLTLKTCINSILYCNSIYLAFLTGARSQEVYSFVFDAIVSGTDERSSYESILGSEFKTNDEIHGLLRDWPLPRAAIDLVKSSQKLHLLKARLFDTKVPKFLFPRGNSASITTMRTLTREIDYSGPSDNLLRRMRPSSAQMVSDISRSPLAVRKVLGHPTTEESLNYCRGKPDDDYREMIEQSKRIRDQKMGRDMLTQVTAHGATERMIRSVLKMGIDQIVSLNLGDEVTVERARDLQSQIDKVKPAHFSEIYEMIGEDRWQIEEFIGESVAQPRPFQFCTAKKGGANFSGACSKIQNIADPQNCKSYCPYNFETLASLEQRAEWIENELIRGHFDDEEVTTEDPIFYNSVFKILDWLWSFEGPLEKFKKDSRLLEVAERFSKDEELVALLRGETRRTLQELSSI
jgi:hypothetical protein